MKTLPFCEQNVSGFAVSIWVACLLNLAQTPSHGLEPSKQYIKEWLLCGPFPALSGTEQDIDAIRLAGMYTDWLRDAGGETKVKPAAGQVVSFPGGTCKWVRHVSPNDAVNLDEAVSKTDRVVAYAYAEIDSPSQQPCILALGSNDGVRAWLNGEPVLDCPGPRGLQLDHNVVPVALRQGRNSLLLKIEERGNRWAFACRFLPFSQQQITERLRLFEVVSRDDGVPVIRARQAQSLTSTVLKSARFEVSAVPAPQVVLWKGDWIAGKDLPIEMDTRNFAQYVLRIKTVLAEGGAFETALTFTAGRRGRTHGI